MACLSLSFDGAVAILTLSAPMNNRFGVEVIDDLDSAIDELTAKEARAILLCADGPDFSHGGDVLPWPNLEGREIKAIFERYMDGFNRLSVCPSLSSRRYKAFATAAGSSWRCEPTS
jgi:enoyl-CoA hydratase/carnithine racemase